MSEETIHKSVCIFNSEIDPDVSIREFCSIRGSKIGPGVKIYERVSIKKSEIQDGVDINAGTYIEKTMVEKDVQIGPNCTIVGVTHDFSAKKGISHEDLFNPITIKTGAWICANVTIMPGVTIGEGAIVGAGSVVNEHVPAGHMYTGTPLSYTSRPIP